MQTTEQIIEEATALTDAEAAEYAAEIKAKVDRNLPDDPRHALLARVAREAMYVAATVTVERTVGTGTSIEDVTVTDVARHRLHVANEVPGGIISSSIPWQSVRSLTVR